MTDYLPHGIRRLRAESLIFLQEYDMHTDSRTLEDAIMLAHHGEGWRHIDVVNCAPFSKMAEMFREKFPECRCRLCQPPEEP